jgi:hypothetical protein
MHTIPPMATDFDLTTELERLKRSVPLNESTVRNPRLQDDALAILQTSEETYVFTRDEDLVTLRADGTCTCGHEFTYAPDEFATRTDGLDGLHAGACPHQRAVLNSIDCGGACRECGSYVIAEKQHEPAYDVTSRHSCAACGAPRHREPNE